ncbi:MAG TPA: 2-C-methyl-D-erythritol 4-phosphate cytidylyltransferase [Mycobacteriales bacterium]|nr:2-C-methyl-D-erythritol 4-phosphate cytidylyltransferase [Mycobacteriales bacterium]
MSTAAVVPAAGRGERLGPGIPKALRPLGGAPMLVHAVRALSQARTVDVVIVAAPPDEVAEVRALLDSHEVPAEVAVVAGGATRQESVARALAALDADVDVVLVHDAARPLAPSELVDAVAGAVRAGADAVVPGLPVVDTVKRVRAGEVVVETLDRSALRAVQTPQGFRRVVLADAHALAETVDATDDAGLVEAIGRPVVVIPGHPEAFKVTRPLDLVLAEAVLAQRRAERVG